MRSFIACIPFHLSGDIIKKDEIGGACRTYGREKKYITKFL
jgi:hypothetical protein